MQTRIVQLAALQPFSAGVLAVCVAAAAYTLAAAASRTLGTEAASFLKALIVAPLVEELLFRGVMQARLRALRGFWGRPGSAITITALAFGVLHLSSAAPVHAALVVLPGIAFGWVYEHTRSIALCVALHSVANAIWIGFGSL